MLRKQLRCKLPPFQWDINHLAVAQSDRPQLLKNSTLSWKMRHWTRVTRCGREKMAQNHPQYAKIAQWTAAIGHALRVTVEEGDQIGRIFANWAIALYGQFFRKFQKKPNHVLPWKTLCNYFDKKWVRLQFDFRYWSLCVVRSNHARV
jgi:hypothetical protein